MDVNPHVRPIAVPEQNSAQLIRTPRLVGSGAFKYLPIFSCLPCASTGGGKTLWRHSVCESDTRFGGCLRGEPLRRSGPDLPNSSRLRSDVCCLDLSRLVTYKFLMLGETIREARIRKGLTQARLAKMAGVSRRHLAALEKGANEIGRAHV